MRMYVECRVAKWNGYCLTYSFMGQTTGISHFLFDQGDVEVSEQM